MKSKLPPAVMAVLLLSALPAQTPPAAGGPASREAAALAEPFRGITTDGQVQPGLFSIRATGVTTEPVRGAAEAFLAALTPEQRGKTKFPVDDIEWRKWMNVHRYNRQGVSFQEMTETHFAWVGGGADDSVFYYRIHSPVVWIEFDHQRPANLRHLAAHPQLPNREHIHVVVRTPNGNDYGKDLLRQHLAAERH